MLTANFLNLYQLSVLMKLKLNIWVETDLGVK